jgi:hypothetical protein
MRMKPGIKGPQLRSKLWPGSAIWPQCSIHLAYRTRQINAKCQILIRFLASNLEGACGGNSDPEKGRTWEEVPSKKYLLRPGVRSVMLTIYSGKQATRSQCALKFCKNGLVRNWPEWGNRIGVRKAYAPLLGDACLSEGAEPRVHGERWSPIYFEHDWRHREATDSLCSRYAHNDG